MIKVKNPLLFPTIFFVFALISLIIAYFNKDEIKMNEIGLTAGLICFLFTITSVVLFCSYLGQKFPISPMPFISRPFQIIIAIIILFFLILLINIKYFRTL